MFKAHAPFLIRFSQEARAMLGCPPKVAAPAVVRAIAAIDPRFDLAYAPVAIAGCGYAASARVMPSGTIVIDVDIAPAGLTPRVVSGAALREAMRVAFARDGRCPR